MNEEIEGCSGCKSLVKQWARECDDTIADLRIEVARLRVIEAAAVACSEHPVWNDDQFYGLMTELQRALRGEVGADETANATVQAAGGALSARSPGTTGYPANERRNYEQIHGMPLLR